MLQTLHPGIFFDESVAVDGANVKVSTQVAVNYGHQPISNAPTNIGAFVGTAPRGRIGEPVLITSWTDYVNEFGGFDVNSYLAYAVKGFFENGGTKCYVVRTVKYNAGVKSSAIASLLVKDVTGTTDSLQVKAKNDGVWGNNISVVIDDVDETAKTFTLKVYYKGVLAEQFVKAKLDTIEEEAKASKLVSISVVGTKIPKALTTTALAGGQDGISGISDSDYLGDEAVGNGLHALDKVKFNLVAIPAMTSQAIHQGLLNYTSLRKGTFAILDAPMSMTAEQVATYVTTTASLVGDFGAIYYPYIVVSDPIGVGKNPTKKVAPSGHIMGVIARQDATNGVWRAPAGIDCQVYGVIDLDYNVSDPEQDILNPVNVNCLRKFDGVGIVAWGARTLSVNNVFRYISVRRTVTFIEDSLAANMKWTNFKPNDETLWSMIRTNVENFLNGIWVNRGLKGDSPEKAYYVKCDGEINTPDVVDAGKTYCDIGLALNRPNEFTIFRLSLRS